MTLIRGRNPYNEDLHAPQTQEGRMDELDCYGSMLDVYGVSYLPQSESKAKAHLRSCPSGQPLEWQIKKLSTHPPSDL